MIVCIFFSLNGFWQVFIESVFSSMKNWVTCGFRHDEAMSGVQRKKRFVNVGGPLPRKKSQVQQEALAQPPPMPVLSSSEVQKTQIFNPLAMLLLRERSPVPLEPAAAELPPPSSAVAVAEQTPEIVSVEQPAVCAPPAAVVSLAEQLRQKLLFDCYRCSATSDGFWHLFVHTVPFYRSLRSASDDETRWYATLSHAGIERGDECSALRWPLSDAAALAQTGKVHSLAKELVRLLCKTAVHECDDVFVDHIVIPSLLCLHEQVLHEHATLRAAEECLELEELHEQPIDMAAAQSAMAGVRNALAWTQPLGTIAQLCCSIISTPSLGMVCAYRHTKTESDAAAASAPPTGQGFAISLPSLPHAALPHSLRHSMECERTSDAMSPFEWHGANFSTHLPKTKAYQHLYAPDADKLAEQFFN